MTRMPYLSTFRLPLAAPRDERRRTPSTALATAYLRMRDQATKVTARVRPRQIPVRTRNSAERTAYRSNAPVAARSLFAAKRPNELRVIPIRGHRQTTPPFARRENQLSRMAEALPRASDRSRFIVPLANASVKPSSGPRGTQIRTDRPAVATSSARGVRRQTAASRFLAATEQRHDVVLREMEAKAHQVIDRLIDAVGAMFERLEASLLAETERRIERERLSRRRQAAETIRARAVGE